MLILINTAIDYIVMHNESKCNFLKAKEMLKKKQIELLYFYTYKI